MPTTVNLRKILDRKQWEPVSPTPVASSAGSFNVSSTLSSRQLFVSSATVLYLYDPTEDAYLQMPAPSWGGTFGAGACGTHHPYGPTGTATAGTSTTITTVTNMAIQPISGQTIRITGGTGAGQERIIASATIGANSIITVQTPWTVTPDATSQYLLLTGRWYVFNAGTLVTGASGSFKYYDFATNTWSTGMTITGLPATWGTDGRIIATPGATTNAMTREAPSTATAATNTTLTDSTKTWTVNQWRNATVYIVSGMGAGQRGYVISNTSTALTLREPFVTAPDTTSVFEIEAHTATAGTGTTLTDSARAWTTNQWTNSQVRILSGTGAGQVRVITSNTATAITVPAWTTTPDSTSTYVIEGDDNALYLMGNNAVTMYKYSMSGNSWSTVAATAARAGAPGLGASGQWIVDSEDTVWRNENAIVNGRRIYSLRGGATSTLDYYDIALGTWVSTIPYARAAETFTTGTGYALVKDKLYIQKEATGRWFRLDFAGNKIDPWSTLIYPQGAALIGDKCFDVAYTDGGTTIRWVYHWINTGTPVFRCMII